MVNNKKKGLIIMLQPIKYYFAIETYDWFTDEKYIELYSSHEELKKGLQEMAERECWDNIKEIFQILEDEKIFSEGYEYIKIYETAIKF
ncbi:MAG: hypothetical protein L0L22_16570 [Staphylococcus equorum]|nr:hypothetical protein [Atopostipes suicloacalis]MDN6266091.1 hypothetical protein [Tetragenococcus halophilus]MDN6496998.1 hypothetical protein [Tetragenococcus koreensis]MDN6572589.1 hypothetical protein [Staphylococcus equorum]MDN6501813.1 hypothetical protein [Tetragenococcus koreensis]